jgi:hypothetical protein
MNFFYICGRKFMKFFMKFWPNFWIKNLGRGGKLGEKIIIIFFDEGSFQAWTLKLKISEVFTFFFFLHDRWGPGLGAKCEEYLMATHVSPVSQRPIIPMVYFHPPPHPPGGAQSGNLKQKKTQQTPPPLTTFILFLYCFPTFILFACFLCKI